MSIAIGKPFEIESSALLKYEARPLISPGSGVFNRL